MNHGLANTTLIFKKGLLGKGGEIAQKAMTNALSGKA